MSEELPAATPRMTQSRSGGMWGSALTSAEFAAIRDAGFEPVGQVYGAAVYAAGSARGYSCPGAWRPSRDGPRTQVSGTQVSGTQLTGQDGLGSFGPLVQAMYEARHTAIDRMTAECAALGGHGVVGVRLRRGSFRLGGLEFTAIGTAIRAPGTAPGPQAPGPQAPGPSAPAPRTPGPRTPFTSDLSGQDFAKLIMAGWVPAGLALGISIGSRHDDLATTRQTRQWSGNTEVAGWTELVSQSRHDARRALEDDVRRLGADGVVIAGLQMRVRTRDCPATVGRHDHIVEATLIGTAIASFSRTGPRLAGPALAVMSLDPQRRQAARIRI